MNNNILLQAVIECHIDGIIILTDRGEIVRTNRSARQVCQRLAPNSTQSDRVPSQIWRICQAMVRNRALHTDRSVMIEDKIEMDNAYTVRIRVNWVSLDSVNRPCLQVTLEDRFQSAQKMAIAERARYGLTERETQVWLLRQADYTYKAIAAQLHITVDTVKKHMRNIHAKRDAFQWAEE